MELMAWEWKCGEGGGGMKEQEVRFHDVAERHTEKESVWMHHRKCDASCVVLDGKLQLDQQMYHKCWQDQNLKHTWILRHNHYP